MPENLPHTELAEQVFADVQERFARFTELGFYSETGGACLPLAVFTWGRLLQEGWRALLQAGDMSWPFAPRDTPEGQPTHFGYEWSPHLPFSRYRILEGGMPEMHVWVGSTFPAYVMLDTSTGRLRKIAEAAGFVWKMPDPPPYLWAVNGELPYGVKYEARPEAMGFLFRWLHDRHDFISAVQHVDEVTACELRKLLALVKHLEADSRG